MVIALSWDMDALHDNVVGTLNLLIEKAGSLKASDIHIEPRENFVNVRFRVDGLLKKIEQLPKRSHPQLISRIKVISNLDISESRVPQDGRTFIRSKDRELDLRISVMPTFWGEKAVIRLLDRDTTLLPLEELGFDGEQLDIIDAEIKKPQGIILVTGPTGSGKTTSLYASLNRLRSDEKNITTIEDPVEYQIPGVNQIQVNERSGMTFARGLRSILRQDPDIIMIGEIRDPETAAIAVRAAMTGHLVLSTLHTNSAVDSIGRLLDIGIESYLLSSSINCIIAQRLVRKWDGTTNGYKGRTGIFEVLKMNKKLRTAIHDKAKASDILEISRACGFKTITDSADILIKKGVTTKDEANRVLMSE